MFEEIFLVSAEINPDKYYGDEPWHWFEIRTAKGCMSKAG
jgi:hypothetical protein